jgi:membrane protein YdbS with pleckstrin-like domain
MLDTAAPPSRRSAVALTLAIVVGLLLAVTASLWGYYGTAVFYETIVAGFIACL